MSSIAEFIEARKSIETLTAQIALSTEGKIFQESKRRLDEANRQLQVLKTMVANDVQVIVVDRLTRQLNGFTTKVDAMAAKLPVKKKQQTAV
jgi:hypothetical protein